mmetsp:Transcript_20263/g.68971  ORF Transcript_20263/g.68971 Transcript_20263/m.68971 type:complete len:632 (-) Transcript_20263:628-2523(-)
MAEVVDRASRCDSAKKQAFNIVVERGFACAQLAEAPGTQGGAQETFKRCVEDFLDSHKSQAFLTAFQEPARLYFTIEGQHHDESHVDVHGLNWYLGVLKGAVGFALPMAGADNDVHPLGVADFWAGLTDEAWELFSKEESLGQSFERVVRGHDIKRLKRKSVPDAQLPEGHRLSTPAGKMAMATVSGEPSMRRQLAVYVSRYTHFFSRDVLVRRLYETLNSEASPQHVGFRAAVEELYASYRRDVLLPMYLGEGQSEHGAAEEDLPGCTLVEHLYEDDMFTTLDLGRTEDFFAWAGVYKVTDGARERQRRFAEGREARREARARERAVDVCVAIPSEADKIVVFSEAPGGSGGLEECPICFEVSADVEELPHWDPSGDVSGHKVCGSCRARMEGCGRAYSCPFCNEALRRDDFLRFAEAFTADVNKRICDYHSGAGDHNELAGLMESWELFEMEHEGAPGAVRRVVGLVLEDAGFRAKLADAAEASRPWARDAAGVLLRFHAMERAGELAPREGGRPTGAEELHAAVESVLAPFERDRRCGLHPHFMGSLYTQAVVAWLCAFRGGGASEREAAALVRRVGTAVAKQLRLSGGTCHGREAADRVPRRYLDASSAPVWGSAGADEMRKAMHIS